MSDRKEFKLSDLEQRSLKQLATLVTAVVCICLAAVLALFAFLLPFAASIAAVLAYVAAIFMAATGVMCLVIAVVEAACSAAGRHPWRAASIAVGLAALFLIAGCASPKQAIEPIVVCDSVSPAPESTWKSPERFTPEERRWILKGQLYGERKCGWSK